MIWEVVYTRRAHDDLRKLDRVVATRVYQAIARLTAEGRGDVRRLRGYEREWRLRVGDWRVRLTYDLDAQQIQVLRILHRSQAYS